MKILNVSLRHIIGGTPQVCLDYTKALISCGQEVTCLINKNDPMQYHHIDAGADILSVSNIGMFGSYDPLVSLYFAWLIYKNKPDVIIAHDGRAINLCRMAAFGKVPIIDVNHGRGPKQSKKTTATIVINQQQLERTKKAIKNKKNIECVANMVHLDSQNITPKVNWNNPPIIGALGRMVSEKAFEILIDACVILKNKNIKFSVHIGGDGELKEDLKRQIIINNLQDEVILRGWVSDIEAFYQDIDIFCLSSRSEACPKVLLDAMKYKLPVVVTNAEGPIDIVTHMHDGIMVEKENALSLAEGLALAITDRKLSSVIANNAHDTIVKDYSAQILGQKMVKMLKEIVGNK